jgi:hypothetical protein
MDFNDIFPEGLDITDAYNQLDPVAIYILTMALYALFIFKFYWFVGSKDVFGLGVSKYEQAKFKAARVFSHLTLYMGKYLFIFPLVAFFWFAVLLGNRSGVPGNSSDYCGGGRYHQNQRLHHLGPFKRLGQNTPFWCVGLCNHRSFVLRCL